MGCSDSLALKYIKKILKITFIKLDKYVSEETPDLEEVESPDDVMTNLKNLGGGDDDVLEDESSDEDDDSSDYRSEESSNDFSEEEEEVEEKGLKNEDTSDADSSVDSEESSHGDTDSEDDQDVSNKPIIRKRKIKEKSEGVFLNRLYHLDL